MGRLLLPGRTSRTDIAADILLAVTHREASATLSNQACFMTEEAVHCRISFPELELEDVFWMCLTEVCDMAGVRPRTLVELAKTERPSFPASSAVRIYIMNYFRMMAY